MNRLLVDSNTWKHENIPLAGRKNASCLLCHFESCWLPRDEYLMFLHVMLLSWWFYTVLLGSLMMYMLFFLFLKILFAYHAIIISDNKICKLITRCVIGKSNELMVRRLTLNFLCMLCFTERPCRVPSKIEVSLAWSWNLMMCMF